MSFTYITQPISQTDMAVFTDGAQDKTDIGAAFIILDKSGKITETKQYKLPVYSNNFKAEGIAILKAIEYLQTSFEEGNVQLYTDNLSTLKAISSPNNRNPNIFTMKEVLNKIAKQVKIASTYINGHSGNVGNEIAGKMPKKHQNMAKY